MPVPVSVALSSFVSPPDPQPGPNMTVGAFAPAASPAAGKKCTAICVPSNDVTVASRADAAGAAGSVDSITPAPAAIITLRNTARRVCHGAGLSHAGGLSRLGGMNIFVAGATGALGKQLVPRLVERGYHVVGMTRIEARSDLIRALGA